MSTICFVASIPFNLGWHEIVFIFLIVAVLSAPGVITLAIVLLVLRHQRRKREVPPPIPAADCDAR